METLQLIEMLQASISPMILISGAGLLLLSMTNRIARPIDALRRSLQELDTATPSQQPLIMRQIAILKKRCKLLRNAIALTVISIASVAVVVLLLFASLKLEVSLSPSLEWLFCFSLISLTGGLAMLLLDVIITLSTIHIEIERHAKANH
ncbi:MAG: DUF2721 domain-containing protein [Desulfovibrio sp.]